MFRFRIYILTVVSLVRSLESSPKSVNCPLVDVEVATLNDVKSCVQILSKRSFAEYCNSEEADCELDHVDCGQTNATHRIFCVWRNCVASCSLMNDQPEACVESCVGLKDECESSKSVQEMIDCHVKLVKTRTRVDESKIICPLLTNTSKSQSELDSCVFDASTTNMEVRCHALGSVCKFADIDDCRKSIQSPWFDARLLCAAIHCYSICYPTLLCAGNCLGRGDCRKESSEESILCQIEASKRFFLDHENFVPIMAEPLSHDKRKLVDCSLMINMTGIVNDLYRDKTQEIVTDCIRMTIFINMDSYCKVYIEECREFPDDCNQAKPKKILHTQEGKKVQVDTHLACLGHKCSKACSEQWKGNLSTILQCRMNCVGNIENCLNQKSGLERLKCHIDHATKFIKDAGNGQSSQVKVTIAIWSVVSFRALALIFNE